MHDVNFKAFLAASITAILFWGTWYLGHLLDVVVFADWPAVSQFLAVNVALWMAPIFVEAMEKPFSFKDHGFALALTAFASLITVGSASFLKGFPIADIFAAFAFVALIVSIHFYLRSSRGNQGGTLPSGYRFLSWMLGVVAAHIYLYSVLAEEIISWSYLF